MKIFAEKCSETEQRAQTALAQSAEADAELKASQATVATLQDEVKELVKEKRLLIEEGTSQAMERVELVREAQEREKKLLMMENKLDQASKLQVGALVRADVAEASLRELKDVLEEREKAYQEKEVALQAKEVELAEVKDRADKAYDAGQTDAFAEFDDQLPEVREKYKRKGWFRALQALKIDPHQCGLEKGPLPEGEDPEDFTETFDDMIAINAGEMEDPFPDSLHPKPVPALFVMSTQVETESQLLPFTEVPSVELPSVSAPTSAEEASETTKLPPAS